MVDQTRDVWDYDPETERWIVTRPGEPLPCAIVALETQDETHVTKAGWIVGWCETHREAEWRPIEDVLPDEE